jgi:hypothetical protein
MKALTQTMKLKSALADKVVESNPVMARYLKYRMGIEAAFSPYLEIQRQWQKTTKQMAITKIFFSPNALNQCQTTFLNTPLFFMLDFLLL